MGRSNLFGCSGLDPWAFAVRLTVDGEDGPIVGDQFAVSESALAFFKGEHVRLSIFSRGDMRGGSAPRQRLRLRQCREIGRGS
jgi:hypothetical protein